MRPTIFVAMVAMGLTACRDSQPTALENENAPPHQQIAAGNVRLVLQQSSYTREQIATGAGIQGTIINDSDRTVYAKLGDAFNSAVEQNPLFVATGSDGVLERRDGSGWVNVAVGHLVEGVREIEIRPGKPYTFVALPASGLPAGTYRVTIAFRATAGGETTIRSSSPTIEVR